MNHHKFIPSELLDESVNLYINENEPSSNPEDSKKVPRIKRLKCCFPGCDMVFTYPSLLERHEATHQDLRKFTCTFPGCEKTFKRGDVLKNHLRTHTKETPFICPNQGCGAKFANKAALRYHIIKNGCQASFKCSVPNCKKSYTSLANLKKHETSCLESLENIIKGMYGEKNMLSFWDKPSSSSLENRNLIEESIKEIVNNYFDKDRQAEDLVPKMEKNVEKPEEIKEEKNFEFNQENFSFFNEISSPQNFNNYCLGYCEEDPFLNCGHGRLNYESEFF